MKNKMYARCPWITGFFCFLHMLLVIQAVQAKIASEKDWPRQIEVPKGTIVIYQPQLEMFNGIDLKARAAIAVTPKGAKEPSYGAVWLEARLLTDRDTRVASIVEIKVPRARFAGSTPAQEQKLSAFLTEEIPKWELRLSLDRLLQGMQAANRELMAEERLISTPAKIYFSEVPAVLISLIGSANLKPIEGLKLQRLVNSPFQIFFDPAVKKYYLNGGNCWFTAQDLRGEWSVEKAGPVELDQLYATPKAPAAPVAREVNEQPPRIVVSSEPAELIVFNGSPQFASLVGAELLYASNTDGDVFLESKTQQTYVLLAGRWFCSASIQGPWKAVLAEALPPCFSRIAADSVKGRVLVHVAGTEMAKDAVLDSQIPQTAVIRRNEAILHVTYDGDPVFKPIDVLGMNYAVNSSFPVIETNKHYYACQYAVWYESEKPGGPWRICVSVPDSINMIPPTCPIFNVKFARVYGSTPDLAYVGYTPGYLGSYVSGGAIVYGTGQTYQDWYRSEYISRPLTWGLRARYDPAREGWGLFADYVSPGGNYRIIPGSVDGGGNRIRRWSMAGWWGAGGYRDYEDMSGEIQKANGLTGGGPATPRLNVYNLYQLASRVVSVQKPGEGAQTYAAKAAAATSGSTNNLYIDRNGNVYRQTAKGWEKREVADWVEARMADAADLTKMDEERRARERGQELEQKYEAPR